MITGVIALENSDDVDICEGNSPVGQILGDGTGGSSLASATFGTISYQWQSSTNNGTSYQDIVGATASNYTPTSITTTTLLGEMLSYPHLHHPAPLQVTIL
ncbi:MAG: hypothetical protein CM15mP122_5400 [Bacteroidota bacterium]|nr:MAG: hypothetical protein CM15mP122_5400 [Bacteroidota bacterium]